MLPDDAFCLLNSSVANHCSSCFYGPNCQFTTAYHGIVSIETLLCSIKYIPNTILIIILLSGSVCNLFSIGTFCQPNTREMGNGIYRLWISIIGQIGLTIVIIHLMIEKSTSGKFACFIVEYVHKALHALYDSLTACTTLERTMVIYQGIVFNKIRSRKVAKLIIALLIMYHFISIIYEPFYRELIYSTNRYWCIIKFSNRFILNYENITNICHFIVPYFINLISPMIWVFALTKNKSTLNKHISIWMNLKNVLFNYKYTILSCYSLVIFNTPRFIATFYLTCIRSQWHNTIYMAAYFLSLFPLMMNLFIFVLPSPKYRPEFFNLLQHIIKYRFRNQYMST